MRQPAQKDLASLARSCRLPAVFTAVYRSRWGVRCMTACLIPVWPATARSTSGRITSPARLPTAFLAAAGQSALYPADGGARGDLALLLAVAPSENHRVNRRGCAPPFLPMIILMVSAASRWLRLFWRRLPPARPLSGKVVRADEQQLAGGAATARCWPPALIGVEVRRLLHAASSSPGCRAFRLDAGSGADGGATRTQVFFKVTLPPPARP